MSLAVCGTRDRFIRATDPVSFQFLHASGLSKKWEISDVFGLDDELLAMLNQPVLALLLLFPTSDKLSKLYADKDTKVADPIPSDLYYMKQTISNACGTVALIHAVANNQAKVELTEGKLHQFLQETKSDTPEVRAEKLEASKEICETHDDVAREGQTAVLILSDLCP